MSQEPAVEPTVEPAVPRASQTLTPPLLSSEPPTNGAAPSDLRAEPTAKPVPVRWMHHLPWLLVGAFGVATISTWLRLNTIQEQLAQQNAQATATSLEARALAKSASEGAREAAAKQSLLEVKLAEVSLQRNQLEDLIQSLSRSRDENLLEDIDSSLRLAHQQSSLTGSIEPLVAALKSADQRINRAAQPRLSSVQRALNKDLSRLKSSATTDVPALLTKLDELARSIDELPLANAMPAGGPQALAAAKSAKTAPIRQAPPQPAAASPTIAQQAQSAWQAVASQAASLVRLSRIDAPEASLVAPEQAYMLRENLKLRILNARLGLLARQADAARADLTQAGANIDKYFDTQSRKTQTALALVTQAQELLRNTDMPRPDDSLAALKLAGATR